MIEAILLRKTSIFLTLFQCQWAPVETAGRCFFHRLKIFSFLIKLLIVYSFLIASGLWDILSSFDERLSYLILHLN